MATTALVTLEELSPELFALIAAQVPLHNRVPTLFSLALASHHFHNIIIPHILYTHVRLVGEDQAVPVLQRFIQAAEENVNNDDHSTMPTSHYIHDLCIHPVPTDDNEPSLSELQRLIDCDGLPNLVSLTIHRKQNPYPPLPTAFWTSLQRHCPNFKGFHLTGLIQQPDREWLNSELFTMSGMKSIRLQGYIEEYHSDPIIFDFSKLPVHLHTLEMRLSNKRGHRLDAGGLLSSFMPNLRVLILDSVHVGKPAATKDFWKKHPRLERLELWRRVEGEWFNDFESGMLPNLTVLKSNFVSVRTLLPHISESLVSLCLWETYNAQAPYLLRTVPKSATLPALRSLGIHRTSGNSPKAYEGHRWREDECGIVSQAPLSKAARRFDGNYLMSIAKAAPNLEELELMGESDDTIDALTSALSRLPKLRQLILSGPINSRNKPFFESSCNWIEYDAWNQFPIDPEELERYPYSPTSFDQAACDLARGCPTLERVTIGNMIGDLLLTNGVSGRIVRDEDGEESKVKEVQRIRAWGNSVGKEEDW